MVGGTRLQLQSKYIITYFHECTLSRFLVSFCFNFFFMYIMWFSIFCNGVVFISSLNHSDLDVKFQEEFNLCSSQRPWEKENNKNECVSGKYTTGQCPFHISFLKKKKNPTFYSNHPNVLFSTYGILSKGLIFYDLYFLL